MTTPQTDERWTTFATRILAPNPGPMTLDGTNTFVIRAPGAAGTVVVDPGPDDPGHVARLLADPVELILLTHHHADHTEAAATLAERTGAPVRAMDAALCAHAEPLRDGDTIEAGGVRLVVRHTPGHTEDSVSFFLPDDAPADGAAPTGSMLTGDTILGRGSTILAQAEGAVAAYLDSLTRLRDEGAGVLLLPAHGPMHPDLAVVAAAYLAHREERIAGIEHALAELRLDAATDPGTVAAVVARVYGDVDPAIGFAAEASARAQLEYLAHRTAGG